MPRSARGDHAQPALRRLRRAAPLLLALSVAPADVPVDVQATWVAKAMVNGLISVTTLESLQQTLSDGETLELPTDGMWEIVLSAPGAVDDMNLTYWIGVPELEATITGDATSFPTSLTVTATASSPRANLYYSLGGDVRNEGANVTITEDAVVSFVAIVSSGNASTSASKVFTKRVAWEQQVTANINEHFLGRRIGATEFEAYLGRFGLARFTLYLVDGTWALDPCSQR